MFHKLKSVVQVMITIQINNNVYRKYADLLLFVLLQAAERCSMQYAQFQLDLYPHHHVLKHAMSGWTLMKVT